MVSKTVLILRSTPNGRLGVRLEGRTLLIQRCHLRRRPAVPGAQDAKPDREREQDEQPAKQ